MKRYIISIFITLLCMFNIMAQSTAKIEGSCGQDCKWSFDGYTLTIYNANKRGATVKMNNYNTQKDLAPWIKKKLNVRKIDFKSGIDNIGSCAFANMTNLQEVVFNDPYLESIGWGAFLNCTHLRTISLPVLLKEIGTIAFANCESLSSIIIPDQCRVADQAFASCRNLKSVEVSPTSILGHYVFATEVQDKGVVRHALYNGEVRRAPAYINKENSHEYGFAADAIAKNSEANNNDVDYDYATSEVDIEIPYGSYVRNNTYALIIGNQNYRFVSNVPYAIHDARVFAEYCKNTLGVPSENVHVTEDATKQMILEEELQDWLGSIDNPESKRLIVYYAGHGVPDIKKQNKAYLLPSDVRGTNPSRGIALDEFYHTLSDLAFQQTTVFLDACFSGVNRENEGVTEGLRGVEIEAEDPVMGDGNLIVISAAQGNETAQGYHEQGHGLFTYYLLNELRNSDGSVQLGRLSDNLIYNVSQKAPQLKIRKKQTPSAKASNSLGDSWRYSRL